jgi:hypothetical protein
MRLRYLISKWPCERSRFRTVLKSGSRLSVVALRAATFSAPREVTSRGGCAVSTDDEDRLTPLRIEVKRQDRDLGIRLGPDGQGS